MDTTERIGIDARMAHNTGIGRYIRGLVNALLRRDDPFVYVLITNPTEDPTAVWDWLNVSKERRKNLEVVSFGKKLPIYSLQEQFWLPKVINEKSLDLFHTPHFNLPLLAKIPIVATLHDAIYLSHPSSAPSYLGRLYARSMLKKAAKRAVKVITATESASSELQTLISLAPEKVTIVPHNADEMAAWVGQVRRGSCEVISPRIRELPPFILTVGHHLPHKNQAVILEALAKLAPLGFPDLLLVLAGPKGRGTAALEARAEALGLRDRVVFLGEILDRDLAFLYDNAQLLVHASKAEGFGLPVLEAMRVGCPVVASDIPPLREVAGKGVEFCEADNADQFASVIGRLLIQPAYAESLTKRGYERSKNFDSEKTAGLTAEVYRSALNHV